MNRSEQFDAALRSALLEAQRLDWGPVLEGPLPEPAFSRRYLRRREALLKNPFQIVRPLWRKALRAAVWLLVAAGVALGGLWLNPSTRAWVEQYLFQRFEEVDEYRLSGDPANVGDLGNIRPGYVPDGFVETEALERAEDWCVTYQDSTGTFIEFWIFSSSSGGLIGFDNEHATRSEIRVDGMTGQLYTATAPEYSNYLLLSDESRHAVYFFSSTVDAEVLVRMAESLETVG